MTSILSNNKTVSETTIERAVLQYTRHLQAVSNYQKKNKDTMQFKNRRNYQRMKEREPEKYKNMLEQKKQKYQELKKMKKTAVSEPVVPETAVSEPVVPKI